MKFTPILLSVLFYFTTQISAQWEWQNPLPQGNHLEKIEFINDQTGWILAQNTFLHTTDGGNSWSTQIAGRDILDFHFINENVGYGVGWGNPPRIVKTVDGGINWFNLNIPSEVNNNNYYNFTATFFINSEKGFISDDSRRIYKTTDGGITWEEVIRTDRDVTDIFFIDSLKGFASLEYAYLLRTTDGGESWFADSTVFLDFSFATKIEFIDQYNGWITSTNKLFITNDGGDSWEGLSFPEIMSGIKEQDLVINQVQFIDENNGVLATNSGLYRSEDGGRWWTQIDGNYNLGGVHFFNLQEGIACGQVVGSTFTNQMFITSDGGITWEKKTRSVTQQDLRGVDFVSETVGWAVGEGGTILQTTDGGQNWIHQYDTTWSDIIGSYQPKLSCLFFLDEYEGWVAGYGGIVLHTANGGNNWEKWYAPNQEQFLDIHFINHDEGWIAGGGPDYTGTIYHTTDGGETWTHENYSYMGRIYSIYFRDADRGWVVTGGGSGYDKAEVYYTTDGGDSLELQVTIEESESFQDIFFVDDLYGFIAGDSRLLTTTDGGLNWEINEHNLYSQKIMFADRQNGFSLGIMGQIYFTKDGGNSWTEMKSCLWGLFLNDLDIYNNQCWSVGEFGAIISLPDIWIITDINDEPTKDLQTNFILSHNYPNPFNPTTQIEFSLSEANQVKLEVFNLLGEKIAELVNKELYAGSHSVNFNAEHLPSGVYIYALTAGNYRGCKKMVLLK